MLRRDPRALIGSAGFKGKPDRHGGVVIGYSLLEPFQGRRRAVHERRAGVTGPA